MDYLRGLAPEERTHYVHRGFDVTGKHPFREARFEIWAPEEDTSHYYSMLTPMALEAGARASGVGQKSMLVPPSGVDAGAFYDLVEARSHGFSDNLLAIDKLRARTRLRSTLDADNRDDLYMDSYFTA